GAWMLRGSQWQPHGPARQNRQGFGMAFDPGSNRPLVFGGTVDGPRDDTLLWDGLDWLPAGSGQRPAPRYSVALASDPVRNVVVLFGGQMIWDAARGCLLHHNGVATMAMVDIAG